MPDLPPSLTVEAPLDGANVTANQLELRGHAHDDTGAPTVEFALEGQPWQPVQVQDGAFSVVVDLPNIDDGTVVLSVRATDKLGQSIERALAINVDDVGPQCARIGPEDGARFSSGVVPIEFTVSGFHSVTLSVDGQSLLGELTAGHLRAQWPIPIEDWVQHTLRLVATDVAGRECRLESTFTVDSLPPRLTIDSPFSGQVFDAGDFASGDSVTVTWSVNDADPTLVVTSPQAPGRVFTPSERTMSVPTTPSDDGVTYTVQVTAVSTLASTTATVAYKVDRIPPHVTKVLPAPGVRDLAGPVVVTFSEPTNSPFVDGGSWDSSASSLTFAAPPEGDTLLTVAVDAPVTDLAGNPLDRPFPMAYYRTPPVYWPGDAGSGPDAGLAEGNDATLLSAASDGESVLNFVIGKPSGMEARVVDPRDGRVWLYMYANLTGAPPDWVLASAFLNSPADAETPRVWGFNVHQYDPGCPYCDGMSQAYWDTPTGFYSQALNSFVLVPAAPFPEEGPDRQPVGFYFSEQSTYYRLSTDRISSFTATGPLGDVIGVSAARTHWIAVESGANGRWAAFSCDAGTCGFFELGTFPDALNAKPYAFAAGVDCDLHVFSSATFDGGLALETVPWTGSCDGGCQVASSLAVAGDTASIVYDPNDEHRFELVTSAGATFDLFTGTIGSSCAAPALAPVSSLTVPQGLRSAQAVFMYGGPAAVYLDGNGTVRLYLPP